MEMELGLTELGHVPVKQCRAIESNSSDIPSPVLLLILYGPLAPDERDFCQQFGISTFESKNRKSIYQNLQKLSKFKNVAVTRTIINTPIFCLKVRASC